MDESGEKTLCSACGVKPMTHHITTIVHGKTEVADLCTECFEKTQPAAVRKHMEALANGSCTYCGAKAAACIAGGMDWLSNFAPAEEERFACHECFQEHHAYLLKRLEAFSAEGQEAPGEAGVKQILAIREETDAHMRRWVSQRLN